MKINEVRKAASDNAEKISNVAYSGGDISVKTIWRELLKMVLNGVSTVYGMI